MAAARKLFIAFCLKTISTQETGRYRTFCNEKLHNFVLFTWYFKGDEMENEIGGIQIKH
jgi:hypothetical protein